MVSPAKGRGYKKPRHHPRQKRTVIPSLRPRQATMMPPFLNNSDSDHESGTEDFGLPNIGNFESSNFSLDLNLSDFTPVPEVSCLIM